MVQIKVKKGLDISIKGKPKGETIKPLMKPQEISLNLHCFEDLRLKLLVRVGDSVKVGQPLVVDKGCERRVIVSPAAGTIKEVRRGLKRRLLNIVVGVADREDFVDHGVVNVGKMEANQIIEHLLSAGLFAQIRQRPFNVLADPKKKPRSIFVKAVETAPLAPPAELQVRDHEEDFLLGLATLAKLTEGAVHLVYHRQSQCNAFVNAHDVVHHTVEGPHPAANHSVHIYHIDPIRSHEDVVWTVTVNDVIAIGFLMRTGTYYVERLLSVGGPGILDDKKGFFAGRLGYPIGGLIAGRNARGLLRMISGDVLTGNRVELEDFLHFNHYTFSVIPEKGEREFLHFLGLGRDKYTASRTYFSRLLGLKKEGYEFTTRQHGEPRYFVDGTIYEKVMPMKIPVMHLIRAIQAKDFELAEKLGLLEVDAEDFALPAFVCPCKVEMVSIIKQALQTYAAEILC